MFLQKANDFFQHSSFVHFAGVAWKHGAELFDENIELIAPLLLRLVTRSPVDRVKKIRMSRPRGKIIMYLLFAVYTHGN